MQRREAPRRWNGLYSVTDGNTGVAILLLSWATLWHVSPFTGLGLRRESWLNGGHWQLRI